MTPATLDSATLGRVREALEELDGVRRAFIEGPPYVAYVIAERAEGGPTEMYVHSVLARHGIPASDVEVNLCHLPAPEPRRRVRFLAARLKSPRMGRAVAEVQLEWGGETITEELEGESGPALELRLAALATIRALDAILQGRVKFELVGIKGFRAFDADLVVALIKSDVGGKPLIGAALATEDPFRSASLAVLNATNRVLGNYLANLDTSAS